MKIPMEFTQEFLEEEILKTVSENGFRNALVEIIVFRNTDSEDLLTKSTVSFLIKIISSEESENFKWINDDSEIEIFKDFTVNPSFFSQVNSHKPEEIIARAYLQENEYTDLVLLNPDKRIARTVLGIPFLIQGNLIKTPKISEGGIRSVTRNFLIDLIQKSNDFTFEEAEIFPFELQKTDELFVLMGSEGILSIHQNRKKIYKTEQTAKVFKILNSDLTLRQAPLDLQI
jgi:branched-chain amino acid aminotransferase